MRPVLPCRHSHRSRGASHKPFTLTTKSCCHHTALALAAESNLKTHKMDVEVAYPNEDNKLAECVLAVPWCTSAPQNAQPISFSPVINQHLIKPDFSEVDTINVLSAPSCMTSLGLTPTSLTLLWPLTATPLTLAPNALHTRPHALSLQATSNQQLAYR